MISIESVAESVDELQFGAQLEERQVEVAAYAELQRERCALQLQRVGALARKVYHRRHTSHEVRAVIVESRRREYKVASHSNVRRLHVQGEHAGCIGFAAG